MPFIGHVLLEPIEEAGSFDRGKWRTAGPLIFRSERYAVVISVPESFETDLASVPRILPIIWMLTGATAIKAAVVHDYIYHHPVYWNNVRQILPREVCDDIFDEIMDSEGVPGWRKLLMWQGVRMGGWIAYGEDS